MPVLDELYAAGADRGLEGGDGLVLAAGPTKTYAYDVVGNITAKSDTGTYTYPTPGSGSVQSHAVSSIAGTINTSFDYDDNGNMTSGNSRTISWTSFNMPRAITRGTNTLSFSYDPERGRVRQVAPDGTTTYLRAFGVQIERFNSPSLEQWNNYVFVGSEIVAVHYDRSVGSSLTRYFHKDHLGSTSVITDEAGTVSQRLSYDAWGKRRHLNGDDDATGVLETTAQSDRGFTGHEIVRGSRDGIDIEVIVDPTAGIWTGYPTNVPRNPR